MPGPTTKRLPVEYDGTIPDIKMLLPTRTVPVGLPFDTAKIPATTVSRTPPVLPSSTGATRRHRPVGVAKRTTPAVPII